MASRFIGDTVTITDIKARLTALEGSSGIGSAWRVAANGTGASQAITIPTAVAATDLLVFVETQLQEPNVDYSVSGTTLTITADMGLRVTIYRPGIPVGSYTGPGAASDTTPDQFAFTDVAGVALSATSTSNLITVAGLGAGQSASVTVSGAGSYSKNGGSFITASTTAVNGDTFAVRHVNSAANSTATSTTLTIGGISDTFTSTTAAPDTDVTPNPFLFTDATDVATSSTSTSNTITVAGINASVAVSITGAGQYSKNGGAFTTAAGTAIAGDTFVVRHTNSASNSTATNTTLTIGGISDTFTSTTVAASVSASMQFVGRATATKAGAATGNSTIALNSGLVGGSRSAVQADDLVIAIYATASTVDRTLTITDGTNPYALIGTELYSGAATRDTNLRVAYKFMGATPDTATTFGPTTDADDGGAMVVLVWSGVNKTTFLDVAVATQIGSGTALADPPDVTPATLGAFVLGIGAGAAANGAAFTSSDLTNFVSLTTSASLNDPMLGAGHIAWSGTGAVNPAQFGGGSTTVDDSWAAMTIALRPATAGTATSDTTPDVFTFTDATGVALSAVSTSNTITVTGINASAAVSVSGAGQYSKNGGAYTTAAGTASSGDTFAVRHTNSGVNSTATSTTLTIGGISDTFTTTTVAASSGGTVGNGAGSTTLTGLAYLWEHMVINHPYSQNFWTSTDPNGFSSLGIPGATQLWELVGADTDGTGSTHRQCWVYNVTFTDSTAIKIAISDLFGGEAAARPYATDLANAFGRLPKLFRNNLNHVNLHFNGTHARAESLGHFITYSKSKVDERITQGKLEEVSMHEAVHACLQQAGGGKGFEYLGEPFAQPPRIVQAWADAVAADNGKYVTNRANDNHGEDFAETGLVAWIMKYRPERMSAEDRAAVQSYIPNRLAYFHNTIYTDPA